MGDVQSKLIGALVLVLILGLAAWRYNYVAGRWDAEKLRADTAEATVLLRDKVLATERQNATDAAKRARDRQTEKEELQRDYDQKVKCIAAGTCGVVVRWKNAICTHGSVRNPDASASGPNDVQAQDQRDFGRWVADLEHAIDLDAKAIEGLQRELAIRAEPNYCRVK